MKSRSKVGFTLVELLVVIAIIGILIALLLPAVQAAREAARRSQCTNNLKQLGIGIHNYHDTYKCFPPGKITPGACCSTQSYTNWAIAILPFVEQKPMFDQYDHNQVNEHANNAFVREQPLEVHQCPSDENANKLERPASGPGSGLNYRHGSYRGMGGSHWFAAQGQETFNWWDDCNNTNLSIARGILPCVGPYKKWHDPPNMANVRDGTSNTWMIGEQVARETTRRGSFWAYSYTSYNTSDAAPHHSTLLGYDRCQRTPGRSSNRCKRGWGSFHPGGLQFCLGDGSVRNVSLTIDIYLFCNLATMSGEELGQLP
jgi:prepilin-type N-terminal cleavage/methylation domain-containing protein